MPFVQQITEHDSRRETGALAEQAAADHLCAEGWRVIARNARWREGEIDIVGLVDGTLVFVEVKALNARAGSPPFSPFESIGRRKQQRIRMLARRWMADELPRARLSDELSFSSIRFDAIAVTVGSSGSITTIDHIADAF